MQTTVSAGSEAVQRAGVSHFLSQTEEVSGL